MEFESNLLSSSKRTIGLDDDVAGDIHQSEILAGNLVRHDICDFIDDEEEMDYEYEEERVGLDEEDISTEDLRKVDNLICDQLGISNLLKNLIKLIISEKLLPSDILVQALAYKVQSLVKGKHSVRYKDSYGMYWAGVRNLVKTRGLVVFKEHFPIPTDLSRMKKKIIETCGLDVKSLGKSGLQRKNVELWVDSKKKEAASNGLGVSLSIDGKKICASVDGIEDLAGLGGTDTISDEIKQHEKNKEDMLFLLRSADSDRASCFMFYDKLTQETAKIICKLDAIEKLISRNSKQVEKNPNLAKYIFVLNQQKLTGMKILQDVQNMQKEIISRIAVKRKCEDCVPGLKVQIIDLGSQQNFFTLSLHDDDLETSKIVEVFQTKSENLLSFPWNDVAATIPCNFANITRESQTFESLFKACFLPEEQVFSACGLSKLRPLADMKEIYNQAYSKVSSFDPPKKPDNRVIASLCSNFSTMSFGQNMVLREGGIFVKDGICSTPDLLVVSKPDSEIVEFTVKIFNVSLQTFKFTEEMLIAALISSSISNASRGSLIVLNSELSIVVFNVPRRDEAVEQVLKFVKSYLHQPKCVSRRAKDMTDKIQIIRNNVSDIAKQIVTLGSYPPVKEANMTLRTEVLKNNILKPNAKTKSTTQGKDVALLQKDLTAFLDETKKYLSKQAKELVCVNVSDLSGSSSQLPHTLLAATYLTGSSLKTIVKDCLSATTELLEKKDVYVLNYAFDGESLHLATTLPDGTPGTDLALAKEISKKLKGFSKRELSNLVVENGNIKLDGEVVDNVEEDEEVGSSEVDKEKLFNDIAMENLEVHHESFSQEDIENILRVCKVKNKDDIVKRHESCSSLKIAELRSLCLKESFPGLKKQWLIQNYEEESLAIHLENSVISYLPSTVFEKTQSGYFRTVTFDPAHISNLLRESAAKGRLEELGLTEKSLQKLSESADFTYLRKILSLKGGSLEFDPMNQLSSATLFSLKTESGLRMIGDMNGAKCCKMLREGIIECMDSSGIGSEERCRMVQNLKSFLNEKIDVIKKMTRPGPKEITSELFQMMNTSLDSHIVSYLNIEFFNPRRKGTGTVEQFFR